MTNLLSTFITTVYNDTPEPWQLGFQDGVSPAHEGVTELHDTIFFYLVIILFGVMWVLFTGAISFKNIKKTVHSVNVIIHEKSFFSSSVDMLHFMFFLVVSLLYLINNQPLHLESFDLDTASESSGNQDVENFSSVSLNTAPDFSLNNDITLHYRGITATMNPAGLTLLVTTLSSIAFVRMNRSMLSVVRPAFSRGAFLSRLLGRNTVNTIRPVFQPLMATTLTSLSFVAAYTLPSYFNLRSTAPTPVNLTLSVGDFARITQEQRDAVLRLLNFENPDNDALSLRNYEGADTSLYLDENPVQRLGGDELTQTIAEHRSEYYNIPSAYEDEYLFSFWDLVSFFTNFIKEYFCFVKDIMNIVGNQAIPSIFNADQVSDQSFFLSTVGKNLLMVELTHGIFIFLLAGFITNALAWVLLPRISAFTSTKNGKGKSRIVIMIGLFLYGVSIVFFITSLIVFCQLFLLTV